MKIIKLEVGNLGTNCYIIYCETSREAAIVDAGGNADEIMRLVRQEKLLVKYIINTHGHADHIMGLAEVKAATGAPVLIHEADDEMLTNAALNLSGFMGAKISAAAADQTLVAGDVIEFGTVKLTVRHTPGHTPGGICLVGEGIVLSGDTLFAESIGRTDFPGGSYQQLIDSIQEQLMTLPDDTKVLPGHGPDTTIGWERKMNSFIQ
jgi:hydroxyacylglutathione hydrolase